MGIMDTVAKTILQVKVEGTAEAKAQLGSLEASEKKLAAQRIDGLEASNKGLEKWIGRMGQFGVALGVAKVAFESFQKYAHSLDLESAAAGVSIEKLRVASKGLKSDMELLEHAAALNSGTFKLTQEQMGTVEKAMYVLEERGKSSEEVWNAMEAALTKGTIKPLAALGVVIKDTDSLFEESGGKLDTYGKKQKALEQVMAELAKTAKGAEGAQLDQADAMQVSLVKLQNYWDQAQLKLGELVTKLGPLLDGLTKAVDKAMYLVNILPGGAGAWIGGGLEGMVAIDRLSPGFDGLKDLSNPFAAGESKVAADMRRRAGWMSLQSNVNKGISSVPAYDAFGAKMGAGTVDAGTFANATNKFVDAAEKWEKSLKSKGDGISFAEIGSRGFDRNAGQSNSWLDSMSGSKPGGFAISSNNAQGSIEQFDLSGLADSQQRAFIEEQTRGSRYDDWMKNGATKQNESVLAKTFGPIEEFNAYAEAFKMLDGAVTTSMNAWIDGSMSAGEALKKFFAGALRGLASQMAVEALKHGAYAIGSLAFGDVRGAGQHAAAAAMFGAGAAAAAVAAKEMGGGAPAAKASGGAGASSGGGSGGNGSGNQGGNGNGKQSQNIVYIAYGDAFADDSPRNRRLKAEQTVRKVLGGDAGNDS